MARVGELERAQNTAATEMAHRVADLQDSARAAEAGQTDAQRREQAARDDAKYVCRKEGLAAYGVNT